MTEDMSKKTEFVKFETVAVGDWILVGPEEFVQVMSRDDGNLLTSEGRYTRESFWNREVGKLIEGV